MLRGAQGTFDLVLLAEVIMSFWTIGFENSTIGKSYGRVFCNYFVRYVTGFLRIAEAISAPDLHFLVQKPFEIRQLRSFLEVADAGNFSRAAKRLGVSLQMRDLEASLPAVLFQCRGKRISLSSAGLRFQEHARAILRQIESRYRKSAADPPNSKERSGLESSHM